MAVIHIHIFFIYIYTYMYKQNLFCLADAGRVDVFFLAWECVSGVSNRSDGVLLGAVQET